jgi:hypothetical protein
MTATTLTHNPKLSATRRIALPKHLRDDLRAAPVIVETATVFDGSISSWVAPDFAALFQVDDLDVSDDPDEAAWEARHFGPAATHLLYCGTEVAFDTIMDFVGRDTFGPNLEVENPEAFDVSEWWYYLPDPVCTWLESHNTDEAAAWSAMFLAEIQMHAVSLATGKLPMPHSTASEMALHTIIGFTREYFDNVLYSEFDTFGTARFEMHGGDAEFGDVINLFTDILFEDDDVLWAFSETHTAPLSKTGAPSDHLHPNNWFKPFRVGDTPWLDAAQ